MPTSTDKWRTASRTTAAVLLALVLILSIGAGASASLPKFEDPPPPAQASPMDATIEMVKVADAAGFVVPEAPSHTGATIVSEYPDYPPGATVTLIGRLWAPGEAVHITVNDDVGQSWIYESDPDPIANGDGEFTHQVTIPSWFVAVYGVVATGSSSGTATTTFTDANLDGVGTYDQCSNDTGEGYPGPGGDTGCRWINGNLNANNSVYPENDATVQRLWLTNLAPGTTHNVTFKYGTTKAGKHSYDFLTTWNWSESWITWADLCQGIPGCATSSSSPLDIPQDPSVPDENVPGGFEPIDPGDRQFVMRGGTLNSATTPTIVSGGYTGDSETAITVYFTVAASGSMCATKQGVTTCDVAL